MDFPDDTGLTLDEDGHRYRWNGQRVGGVSEIISALGLVDRRWFTNYSRDRGTAVHLALEYLVRGVLDWRTVDPRIEGYVRAGEAFLAEACVEIGGDCLTEHLVYHPGLRYAGKLDLFAVVYGEPAVVDYKSGGLGCAGIQTAAYEGALRAERGDKKPYRRIAVQLRDDGTYRKHDYRSANDYAVWAACALVFNEYHLKHRKDEADAE